VSGFSGGSAGAAAGGSTSGIPLAGVPEVKNGWVYFVRPPRFPIGKTPRQRGGVRASGAVVETHFVLAAEATVERIFFVKGCDGAGKESSCPFVVEGVPREGSAPPEVSIEVGWFVERRADAMSSTGWTSLAARRISDLAPDDPVLAKYKSVVAAGQGAGGGGGGAGGASIT
jgi:hypothetical protein